MSDILSQSEIDQLLNALNAGELDVDEYQADKNEKQVKEYDFARPAKFAKDHLRTLEIIHEHYARLLATLLSGRMRTPCQLEVISSEAISYSEFANSLSNPVLLGILEVRPLKGNFVIEMSSNIGFAIVDRLLGGSGAGVVSGRDFTEIEQTVIQRVMSIMIDEMVEVWKNVVNHSKTNANRNQPSICTVYFAYGNCSADYIESENWRRRGTDEYLCTLHYD